MRLPWGSYETLDHNVEADCALAVLVRRCTSPLNETDVREAAAVISPAVLYRRIPIHRGMASAILDGSVKIWDLTSSRELATLRGHQSQAIAVSWSPDGKWLASAAGDKTVRIWSVETRRQRQMLNGQSDPKAVSWSPDSKMLATAGATESGIVNTTTTPGVAILVFFSSASLPAGSGQVARL